jgi:transcriptional regulator with XRE-family HTH domain
LGGISLTEIRLTARGEIAIIKKRKEEGGIMKMNEIIRTRRKALGMTQEQVAVLLGVSTPAVNKWESASSYPDITILPALARLLKVDLNTLLSFEEDLSDEKIAQMLGKIYQLALDKGFEAAYQLALSEIRRYPRSDRLILSAAQMLEGVLVLTDFGESREYFLGKLEELYQRAADSSDTAVSNQAKTMMVGHCLGQKQYDRAQEILDGMPDEDRNGKQRMQTSLYISRGMYLQAKDLLERQLMQQENEVQNILSQMLSVALQEGRQEDAQRLADISRENAKRFELWEYNQLVAQLEVELNRRDAQKALDSLEKMMEILERSRWDWKSTFLYRDILQEKKEEAILGHQLMQALFSAIEQDSQTDFLLTEPRYQQLAEKYQRQTETAE